MKQFDIIVIGAGIAGASIAAHLAKSRNVVVLEMEERAGYHTTGRSAASFEPNYGPPPILTFTRASHDFFVNPPQGFRDAPLLTPRNSLWFMADGQEPQAEMLLEASTGLLEISTLEALKIFPVLRDGYAKRSFLDPQTGDIDVDTLHRGYLRLFKERGGQVVLEAQVTGLLRRVGLWQLATPHGIFAAPIVVNAAGAWGDVVAKLGGVAAMGLTPKRRSIGLLPVQQLDPQWPMVSDVGETWYAKPQSGKLLVSSADATPVEPHDAYADDMAIAEGVDRLMTATTIEVEHLDHRWGGLRTFARDGNPVIGFDPNADGFFWLVGQGGYGIQSAPALSLVAAEMLLHNTIPDLVLDLGLDPNHILPDRFLIS
jgi:D-arginine dehydrogenase